MLCCACSVGMVLGLIWLKGWQVSGLVEGFFQGGYAADMMLAAALLTKFFTATSVDPAHTASP